MAIREFKNQIVGSSHLDSQGERHTKEDLEYYCARMPGRQYVHRNHDMRIAPPGYIENLRVAPSEKEDGEWVLLGDVTVDEEYLDETIGGFSISYTRVLIKRDDYYAGVYLPYPLYNDEALMQELARDPNLNIGKIVQKGADTALWTIILSPFAWIALRVADAVAKEIIDRTILPSVRRALDVALPHTSKNAVNIQVGVPASVNGLVVEVRIVPPLNTEGKYLTDSLVRDALMAANDRLVAGSVPPEMVQRIVLEYSEQAEKYEVTRVEPRPNMNVERAVL